MRKLLLSLFAFIAVGGAAWADVTQGLKISQTPSTSIIPATSEDDNDHWYLITQNRDGESPVVNVGAGETLKRAANTINQSTLDGNKFEENKQYLIRFFSVGDDLYTMQFADGCYITTNGNSLATESKEDAATFAFYITVSGSTTFGWNYLTKGGSRVDNNGAGKDVVLWGSGVNTATSGNNVWKVYSVELEEYQEPVNISYEVYYENEQEPVASSSNISMPVHNRVVKVSDKFPASLKNDYCNYEFYSDAQFTQPIENITASGTIYVNAKLNKDIFPFELSASYGDAKWYTMIIHTGDPKDVFVDETEPYTPAKASLLDKGHFNYQWAFAGNPYKLIVYNRETGSSQTLTKEATDDGIGNAVMRDGTHTWVLGKNGNGFTLKFENTADNYINLNGGKFRFWNTTLAATGAGSTFLVEEALEWEDILEIVINDVEEAIKQSQAKTPGYPTSEDCVNDLNQAIASARSNENKQEACYTLNNALPQILDNHSSSVNYLPQTGVYYTITSSRGSMVYDPSHDNATDATSDNAKYLWYTTETLDGKDPNTLWGFVEKDGLYYMYNVGKEQFATVGKGSYGPTWIFSDTPSYITLDDGMGHEVATPKVRILATLATATERSYAMSISTSYTGPVITYDAVGDGGIPMQFIERGEADPELIKEIMRKIENPEPYREALKALIASVASVTTGDGLGEYSASSDYASVLEAANAAVASTDATIESLTAAREALEAAIATLTLNMPQPGTFLRLEGISEMYLSERIADNDNKTFTMSGTEDATTIFYFDGQYLINLSTGKANAMSSSQWKWVYGTETASVVTFREGDERGKYYVGSGGQYFHDKNNTSAGEKVPCVRKGDARVTTDGSSFNWTLTEITKLPITVSSLGFATLWSPVALEIPAEVTAYTGVISEDEKSLKLTPVVGSAFGGTTLPAQTAVLLQAEPATYNFSVSESNMEAIESDLKGGLGQEVTSSILTLQQPTEAKVPGFYTYTGTGAAGFKAYLTLDDASGVKGLTFIFGDDATGIAGIENGNTAEGTALYNLAGQRVAKTVKGIYVVGGKKVLVK
ncbi:MAG: hypothetical protein J1F27_00505 [Prevotellaceae bacterium]|nr:hypothetical protein [Prevotellaceae bacterium]